MTGILFMALLSLGGGRQDTSIAVTPGQLLDVRNDHGEIHVSTWDRDVVRIETGGADDVRFRIDETTRGLRVRPVRVRWPRTEGGRRSRVARSRGDLDLELTITVPRYLHLQLQGIDLDIVVTGTEGEVVAETVEGDIDLSGGRGDIRLHTVEGSVRLEGAQGSVEVSAGDGDVTVRDVQGPSVEAESIDGTVLLDGIGTERLEAVSVSGDVTVAGAIRPHGRYRLSSQSGDITLLVDHDAGATVAVTSYAGAFETAFPIVLRDSRRRRFEFVLGSGEARVSLQTFSGDIYLRRRR